MGRPCACAAGNKAKTIGTLEMVDTVILAVSVYTFPLAKGTACKSTKITCYQVWHLSLFSFYKLDIRVEFCSNNQYSFHRLFSLILVLNYLGSVNQGKLKTVSFFFLVFLIFANARGIQTKGASLKTVNLAGGTLNNTWFSRLTIPMCGTLTSRARIIFSALRALRTKREKGGS